MTTGDPHQYYQYPTAVPNPNQIYQAPAAPYFVQVPADLSPLIEVLERIAVALERQAPVELSAELMDFSVPLNSYEPSFAAVSDDDYQTVEAPFPHCDSRILHSPTECQYCDEYPILQAERIARSIAFSGHVPVKGQTPCPADAAVASGERGDYNQWGGNVAQPTGGDQ
jgi:hypothetical protein